jgi:hypothetical protein
MRVSACRTGSAQGQLAGSRRCRRLPVETSRPGMVKTLREAYLQSWVAHSDAGLLWRLTRELQLWLDQEYWAQLVTPTAEPNALHGVLVQRLLAPEASAQQLGSNTRRGLPGRVL